jgi:hypothetical protein
MTRWVMRFSWHSRCIDSKCGRQGNEGSEEDKGVHGGLKMSQERSLKEDIRVGVNGEEEEAV